MSFKEKFDSFLNKLSELDGWRINYDMIERFNNELCECPLTAVANVTAEKPFNVSDFLWAGRNLGFTEEESMAIAMAADGEDDYLGYNLRYMKQAMLSVTLPQLLSGTINTLDIV